MRRSFSSGLKSVCESSTMNAMNTGKRSILSSVVSSKGGSEKQGQAASMINRSEDTSSSVADPVISWGTSINVCEEIRTQIKKEIEFIDDDISSLKKTVHNEERVSNQLGKDLTYAKSQIMDISKEATDILESAIVNGQVREKMEDALNTEIIKLTYVDVNKSNITLPQAPIERGISNEANESMNGTYKERIQLESETWELNSYLMKLKEEKIIFLEKVKADLNDIKRLREKIKNVTEEGARIQKRFHSVQLKKIQDDVQREVQYRQIEYDKEKALLDSLKNEISKTRKSCGDYSQQLVDQSNDLSKIKSTNSKYKENMASTLVQMTEDLNDIEQTQYKAKEQELELVRGKLSTLNKNLEAYVDAKKKISQVQVNHNKIKQVIESLITEESMMAETTIKISTRKKDAELLLKQARELSNEAELIKDKNDKVETIKIKPAIDKQKKHLQEKKELIQKTKELKSVFETKKEQYHSQIQSKTEDIGEVHTKIESYSKEEEELKQTFLKLKEQIEVETKDMKQLIQEAESEKIKWEEFVRSEQEKKAKRLKVKEETEELEKQTLLIEKRRLLNENEFKVEVYKRAIALLQTTEKKERDLL